MKFINMSCPNCGAKLVPDANSGSCTCECCGSSFVMEQEQTKQGMSSDDALVAGYEFEKGRQIAQYEAEKEQIAAAQAAAEARRRQQEAIRAQRAAQAAANPRKRSKAWIWILVGVAAGLMFVSWFLLAAIQKSGFNADKLYSNSAKSRGEEEYTELTEATEPTYEVIQSVEKANVVTFEADLQENGASADFEYTAPRNGRYELVIKSNENHGPTVTITDDLGNEILNTWFVGQRKIELIGENKYHINLYSGSTSMVITFMIIEQKEKVEITELGAVADSMEYKEQVNYYSFTPEESGTYSIGVNRSNGSLIIDNYVYDEYSNEIAKFRSAKTFDKWCDVELSEGTTYTICCCEFIDLGDYELIIVKK